MPTAPQNPKITLSSERFQQLVDLRDANGLASLSDAIRELLATYREVNKLDLTIPGIDLLRQKNCVQLNLIDQRPVEMSIPAVKALAAAIRDYNADPKPRKSRLHDDVHDFEVTGVGRAVAIKVPADAEAKKLAPDVASDLADLLEQTAS